MKQFSLLFMFLLSALSLMAQKTVTGTVLDADNGEPLISATVVVKGTTTGAVTDFDGKFSIEVPADNQVLEISYTGYETQEVDVSSSTNVTVNLSSGTTLVDVVVEGYRVVRKEELVSSVSVIKADKIKELPVATVDEALQGNATGVTVFKSSGQPGAVSQVRVRGETSLTLGGRPLYVIDGVPLETGNVLNFGNSSFSEIAAINPADIETMTVLKDAAATAQYGARGANGVIVITTKSGKRGERAQISFTTQFGVNEKISDNFKLLNSQQTKELGRESVLNVGGTQEQAEQIFPDENWEVDTDWKNEAFRTGTYRDYNLSARGGSKSTGYFISAGMADNEGIVIGSSLKRYTGRIKLNSDLNDRLSTNFNISATYSNQTQAPGGSGSFMNPTTAGYLLPTNIPLYNDEGTYNYDFATLGGANFVGITAGADQFAEILNVTSNVGLRYRIIDGLFATGSANFYLNDTKETEYYGGDLPPVGRGGWDDGYSYVFYGRDFKQTYQAGLQYNKIFNNVHSVGAQFVTEYQRNYFENASVAARTYVTSKLRTLSSAAEPVAHSGGDTESTFMGLLLLADYNYDGKYYFQGSIRRDGSSRFGENNRYAYFPAVGVSWRLSQEDFLKGVSFLDDLKLKFSYGSKGNAGIGNFDARQLYGFGGVAYNGQAGTAPSTPGNPDLRWEITNEMNLGLDFGLFKRLSGSIELYRQYTSDMLLNVRVPATSGFTSTLVNVGDMSNIGIEGTISYDVVSNNNVLWNISANISRNINKIEKMADVDGDGEPDVQDNGFYRWEEGRAKNSFFAYEWAGVDPATGAPLWYDENGNVTNDRSTAVEKYVGVADPDYYGSINTNVSYKGVELSAMFFFTVGNSAYDQSQRYIESYGQFLGIYNQSANYLDRWQNPGDVTDVPIIKYQNTDGGNEWSTSRHIHDTSYGRLRNVKIAYTFDKFKSKSISSVKIYAQGQNLFTVTPYKGFDPEFPPGSSIWFRYPNQKSYTVGLNVNF